ncbi:MAG: HlyD family efflux transporter periplasmic adaptor subunit [Acidobacteria bacterium]|nr:HlyD family efflux transporter periplasmic adaptor subunit [Acidobacteriota bacterium]
MTRTAKIAPGSVERSFRLTGVTAAENFVSLISPQLRGSRSDRGRRSSGGGGSSGDGGQQIQSTARSSSGNTPSVSTGGSDSGVTSTSSAASSGTSNSAFRSATSRSAQSSAISRGGGSTRSTGGSSSAALGSDGLGSTGGSLGQGMGGGGGDSGGGGGGGGGRGGPGGGGEFALVLQQLIKPGSMVKKGEVVAEFDRQYMMNRLDDYRDSVVQNEAGIRKQMAQLEVTRKAHEQQVTAAKGSVEKAALDLKTTPVRSAIDSERLRLALEEATAKHKQLLAEVKYVEISEQSQIRTAEIGVQESKVELRRAEMNADRMISKAPIDGLVVMQQTFRGSEFAQIQQGDQVFSGQPFMQIVDLRSMVINATVNQADVESLRIGQRARVRFDAYPDLELTAHVFSVGAIARQGGFRASYMKEIPVRLRLDKMDPRVIPDLSVSADVIVEREEQAAMVAPLESVFRDGAAARPYVFVREAQGWRKREVELGLASNVAAAIRSGLQPGEVVALARPAEEPKPGESAVKQQN